MLETNTNNQERIDFIRSQRKDSVVLATELIHEIPYLVKSDDNLYVYNGRHYDIINDDYLKQEYGKFVVNYGITDCWKGGRISDILSFIKAFPGITKVKMNERTNLLCMNNGVLDINTGDFFEHSPTFHFDTAIDVVYEKDNTECPVFMEYLTHVLRGDDESIENVIRLGGYLLDYSTENMRKCNKMFLFDGPGGAGKSVLVDTFSLFFSEKQITAIDLDELAKQDMEKEDLLTSRFNVTTEQKRNYVDAENIKKIISGERLKIKRKFNQPITFKPKTKIVVACNGLPKFNDTSEGIYRRLVIFKFRNQYKNHNEFARVENPEQYHIYVQDRDLFSKIEKEKSAIFNLFLGGLKKLKDENFLFLEGNEFVTTMEEFKSDNDASREFLKERYIVDNNSFIPVREVFQDFRLWHSDNVGGGHFKFRSSEMGRRIKEVFNIESNGRQKFKVGEEIQLLSTYPIKRINYDDTNGDVVSNVSEDNSAGTTYARSQEPKTLWTDR